jgi:hypothetical protein
MSLGSMIVRKTRGRLNALPCLAVVLAAAVLPGCGGGSGSPTVASSPTPPPPPAAIVTGTGAGSLVLHPSLDPRFAIAMETPIRLTETAGGSADWGFARMQFFRRGAEVERVELTANDIVKGLGTNRISASSNKVYSLLFRFNSDDFDDIALTLGFSDVKDARQFTVNVNGNTFNDVAVSLTPLSLQHSKRPL